MSDKPQIFIPPTSADSHIGDVLISLFSVINATEENDQNVTWDFQSVSALHPFCLNALAIYRDLVGQSITLSNICPVLASLFDAVHFESPLVFNDNKTASDILQPYQHTSLTPICKFSRQYRSIDEMQSALYSCVDNHIRHQVVGWNPQTPISYLISELICNIQEHSSCSHGFLSILCPSDEKSMYICIADNGITIYGSYMHHAKRGLAQLIGSDHAEALRYSTIGLSTKNRPEAESRGYGISTNLNMVVKGLKGDFFILSGNAFFRSDSRGEQFVNLPKDMNWDGTIILIKIPLKQDENFCVYKYI